jgi:exoribonuclease-2
MTMTTARGALKEIAWQAMRDRGFEPDYSKDALAQVNHTDEGAVRPPAPARRDLRDRMWCSIDNDDSRDLDQLTVAEARAQGTGVLVAIADVDALVPRDSPVDRHAATNTTSVYTAAEVFSMLPEHLSTDLTSLAPDVDRTAVVIDMTVTPEGEVASGDVYLAVVRNKAKLAYPGVGAWLENDAPPPGAIAAVDGLADNLRLQAAAADALKQSRHRRGALTLDTAEGRPVFAGEEILDIEVQHRSRASELIEDFMIAANTTVARFLESHGFYSVRRIVRMPERWPRIVDLAAETGTRLPATADHRALEEWLLAQRAKDPARFADVSLAVVKLLGRGEYVVEPPDDPVPDHFGLAVDDYTHSTAPNRRFADLVTQRLVKAALEGHASPYGVDELTAIAARCSEREDAANRVERQVRKAAAAMLLAPRRGQTFDGVVTGASQKGTWVKIRHPLAEGRLQRGYEGLQVGDGVRVRLIHTDAAKGFIDFERA